MFIGCLLSLTCSTDRLRRSFVPLAIRLYSATWRSTLCSELPAPIDPKIEWESEFCPKITWTKPSIPEKCVVNFTIEKRRESDTQANSTPQYRTPRTSVMLKCMSREEGVSFSITTTPVNCSNLAKPSKSKSVVLQLPRNTPEVVKDFRCVYYAYHTINCTWQPSLSVTHLQSWFSYGKSHPLRPCPLSMFSGSQLIGCHLKINNNVTSPDIFFLLNGTQGTDTINNTFKADLKNLFKPPPPDVSIKLVERLKMLEFSWNPPDFPEVHCFNYQLNYTKCDTPSSLQLPSMTRNYSVDYDSKCQYSVTVRSLVSDLCGQGGSEPSQVQVYGSTSSDLQMIVVAICLGVPMCVGVILFFFANKYREKFLPKIPEPHLGSVKGLMERLYVPAPERVEVGLEVFPNNTDGTQHNTQS